MFGAATSGGPQGTPVPTATTTLGVGVPLLFGRVGLQQQLLLIQPPDYGSLEKSQDWMQQRRTIIHVRLRLVAKRLLLIFLLVLRQMIQLNQRMRIYRMIKEPIQLVL